MTDYQKVVIETEINHAKKEISFLHEQLNEPYSNTSYIQGREYGLNDKIKFLEKLLTINE